MPVTIAGFGGQLSVDTPYDPTFPPRARALGGKWEPGSKTWTFDARDEPRVRALCREIYGTDGTDTGAPGVTVRLPLGWDHACEPEMRVAGLRLAYRPGRDMPVRLADNVIVHTGGFPDSGGSVKNPRLACEKGTVLEVRDVPVPVARKMLSEVPGAESVDGAAIERAALLAERAALLARLTEIDTALIGSVIDSVFDA